MLYSRNLLAIILVHTSMAGALALSGCTLTTIEDEEASEPSRFDHVIDPESGETVPIDPDKELLITDPSVIDSVFAKNAEPEALWSFRAQMEWLAGSPAAASNMVERWLVSWADTTTLGAHHAPVAPRPELRARFLRPWSELQSSQAYSGGLDLWRAPIELIAIVNRVDLALDGCAGEAAGELRYVYAATDPVTREPLDMTIILELQLPPTRSAAEWARAFHALGTLPFGSTYNQNLAVLTRDVRSNASRASVRIGTNEAEFSPVASAWQLRTFQLRISPERTDLEQVLLERTPRTDALAALQPYLTSHVQEVLAGTFSLPIELRAAAADLPQQEFRWPLITGREELDRAFSRATCNGCHGGDARALPFQHLALDFTGSGTRISQFLAGPQPPDELTHRALRMNALLTSQCASVYEP